MKSPSQDPGRVLYVTGPARELPQAVRQWLNDAAGNISASPDIYDALALLTQGQTPNAIMIPIDAVDWNEMDFFNLARNLSPKTQIFVAGSKYQLEKINTACDKGAKQFDVSQINQSLARTIAPTPRYEPGGLLAGSLTTAKPKQQILAGEPVRPPEITIPPLPSPAKESVIRLIQAGDAKEQQNKPIPFPWTPDPDRPKRTPPKAPATPASFGSKPANLKNQTPFGVELTPEEIKALTTGQTGTKNESLKEKNQ